MGEKSRERREERVNEAVWRKDLVFFTVRVKEGWVKVRARTEDSWCCVSRRRGKREEKVQLVVTQSQHKMKVWWLIFTDNKEQSNVLVVVVCCFPTLVAYSQ